MSQIGQVKLNTQEAIETFYQEHYSFVYTTALEITQLPSQAQALTEKVFRQTVQRFAQRPISNQCDMYLAAQVNLLYARGIAAKSDTIAAAEPQTKALETIERQPLARQRRAASSPLPNVTNDEMTSTGGAELETIKAAPDLNREIVNTTPVAIVEPAQMPIPAAPMPYYPLQQSVVPAGQAMPMAWLIPANGLAPAAFMGAVPALSAVQTVQVPLTAPEPVMPVQAQPQVTTAPPAEATVYNPDETVFWTPNSKDEPIPVVLPVKQEPETGWYEEEDKPSGLLSILNGVLAIGCIAAIGFLLWQLDILPKLW